MMIQNELICVTESHCEAELKAIPNHTNLVIIQGRIHIEDAYGGVWEHFGYLCERDGNAFVPRFDLLGEHQSMFKVEFEDFTQDEANELIVTGPTGLHSAFIRVIDIELGEPALLFEKNTNTPNVYIQKLAGNAQIVIEEALIAPDYVEGKRTSNIYEWNGRGFADVATS
ncbi:MAG: hypothetical protein ACI9CF_001325 [Candidatus Omnitrophota bacterium]|jgi:hypothetical protein